MDGGQAGGADGEAGGVDGEGRAGPGGSDDGAGEAESGDRSDALDMASIELASRTLPKGASSATSPLAAGAKTALAAPAPAWMVARPHTVACPEINKVAVRVWRPQRARSAPSMSTRREWRSPSTPPKTLKAITGTRLATSTSPRLAADELTESTANTRARVVRAFPALDALCPAQ